MMTLTTQTTRTTLTARLAVLVALACAPGCLDQGEETHDFVDDSAEWHGDRSTYVLVHGAFQDSSSWDFVKPLLAWRGHRVITVDLPGRNGDPTPAGEISLADHVDAVAAVVADQPRPVILVGHSFGGIVISQVAELMPERIEKLVYVAASLPQDGGSLLSQSQEDHWNGFTEDNFIVAPDYTTASVLEDDRLAIFCADCRPIAQHKLLGDFHDEPLAPLAEPVSLTEDRFGATPKVYIKTLQDNAISTPMQDIMLARTPVDEVFEIGTSHSPFYTRPFKLARILASL